MAVFFVMGLALWGSGSHDRATSESARILGGPVLGGKEHSGIQGGSAASALAHGGGLEGGTFSLGSSDGWPGEENFQGAALEDGNNPISLGAGGISSYTVESGDTLSRIAAEFGISVQTVIASNPEVKIRALQIGQRLIIPPVSGILRRVEEGETPESIAASFHLTTRQLREFNRSVDFGRIEAGTVLVIPGATSLSLSQRQSGGLPDVAGYFVNPAEGFNWGRLHQKNAVDIANRCGTPVVSAAEGLVVDISADSWSYGYGRYVVVEHPNGVKTRYAHLRRSAVSLGDYVEQGELVGEMGETGEASGCHLHFEVEGAHNPFAE